MISADHATHAGQQFLVVVDHLSNWPFVFQLGTTSTARQLIHSFRQVFCFSGAPDVFYSDNGPQFNAYPLKSFLADWGVEHRTSSPHYPQSNGHAEAAVKSIKRLLRHCWCDGHLDDERWTAAILQYRNTPGSDGQTDSATLSKTSSRLITEHLPIDGSLLQSMLMLPANVLVTNCRPKPDTTPLQPHFPIFRLTHRLRSRIRQPSYGIDMASSSNLVATAVILCASLVAAF